MCLKTHSRDLWRKNVCQIRHYFQTDRQAEFQLVVVFHALFSCHYIHCALSSLSLPELQSVVEHVFCITILKCKLTALRCFCMTSIQNMPIRKEISIRWLLSNLDHLCVRFHSRPVCETCEVFPCVLGDRLLNHSLFLNSKAVTSPLFTQYICYQIVCFSQ